MDATDLIEVSTSMRTEMELDIQDREIDEQVSVSKAARLSNLQCRHYF
jgi:hypothetical protein